MVNYDRPLVQPGFSMKPGFSAWGHAARVSGRFAPRGPASNHRHIVGDCPLASVTCPLYIDAAVPAIVAAGDAIAGFAGRMS